MYVSCSFHPFAFLLFNAEELNILDVFIYIIFRHGQGSTSKFHEDSKLIRHFLLFITCSKNTLQKIGRMYIYRGVEHEESTKMFITFPTKDY